MAGFFTMTLRKQNTLLMSVCVIAFSALFFESHHVFQNIAEENEALTVRKMELEQAVAFRQRVVELTLTAMDVLVDKNEGRVSADRKQSIKDNFETLSALEKKLQQSADSEKEKKFMSIISAELPKLKSGIEQLVVAVSNGATDEEFARLDDLIDSTPKPIIDAATEYHKSLDEDFAVASESIDNTLASSEMIQFSLIGLLAVFVFPILMRTSRALGTPLSDVVNYLEELEHGDDDFAVQHTKRSDEIGDIARAIAALKVTVTEAFAMKQMIDTSPNNIMSVDVRNNFTINYSNEASMKTMRSIEHLLPIKASDVIGQSFDIFHKNPQHQRRLLADPSNLPHKANITIANYRFELLVNAIYNKKGEYTGAMLVWTDITSREQLVNNFERDVQAVVNTVASAATELSQTAQSLTDMVNRSSNVANNAAAASAQTTSNVQSVASAAEEMSASVHEISSQIQRTNHLVQESVEKARGADVMATALQTASHKVSDVVKLISDISGQINLLALNATIESARAGEAGKGFAVVASEVKNLANQVDTSLESVASVLKEMDDASSNVVQVLTEIRGSISQISEATSNVASAVEEQSATTNDIARNMSSAADGTRTVTNSLSEVSGVATQASASSTQMLQATQELSQQAEFLNRQVGEFLKSARS